MWQVFFLDACATASLAAVHFKLCAVHSQHRQVRISCYSTKPQTRLVLGTSFENQADESHIASWQLPLRLLTATDGLAGLRLVERHWPDVLITDLVMQPMDGTALLRLLRLRPELAAMSIAVVTSLDDEQLAWRGGLSAGTALYRKPVSFERLHGFVEAISLRMPAARS